MCSVNYVDLGLPSLQPATIDHCFSEEEVWQVIAGMPIDKASGPGGFFYGNYGRQEAGLNFH